MNSEVIIPNYRVEKENLNLLNFPFSRKTYKLSKNYKESRFVIVTRNNTPELPEELLHKIITLLDPASLLTFLQCSKKYSEFCKKQWESKEEIQKSNIDLIIKNLRMGVWRDSGYDQGVELGLKFNSCSYSATLFRFNDPICEESNKMENFVTFFFREKCNERKSIVYRENNCDLSAQMLCKKMVSILEERLRINPIRRTQYEWQQDYLYRLGATLVKVNGKDILKRDEESFF